MPSTLPVKLLSKRKNCSYSSISKISIFFLSVFLLQANRTFAQWTRRQDAWKKHGELTSILYKGKIYNFTGFGVWPEAESSSEVYDPVLNRWTLLAAMPDGKTVTHQGVARVDDKVWHIGGRLKNTTGPLTNEVWIYDLSQNNWQPGPSLKDPATGAPILWAAGGAALVGRTLHVFGGFTTNACNNDQDKYHLTLDVDKWLTDPQNTTWENKLTPLPIKRNHVSTTVLGGKIYALGGQFGHDCNGGQDQKYSHVYNPLTDQWTRLTDLPSVRSHCEAAIFPLDGKIYMAGGDGAQNKVTVLNPDANGGLGSWSNVAALQLPKNYIGVSAKVVGTKFIISCGKWSSSDTRKETYQATISRSIPYKFGFTASCLSKTVPAGEKTTLKNLLFTVEEEKNYTLTSNASWLKITKNATGLAIPTAVEIEATIDATDLAPGNYQAIVTVNGTGGAPNFTSTSFCVNLSIPGATNGQTLTVNTVGNGTVSKTPDKPAYNSGESVVLAALPASGYQFAGWSGAVTSTVNPLTLVMNNNQTITANFTRMETLPTTIRINAGGTTQTINGITWSGCSATNSCSNYVKGGAAYTQKNLPFITGASFDNLNQSIYQTEWTGGGVGTGAVPVGATAFSYTVPVSNGDYLVRLYFTELNKTGANLRQFDVKMEGNLLLSNFDVFVEANGIHKAIKREFPVSIADGAITIEFIRRIENAKISAIEIIPRQEASQNINPTANAGSDLVVTAGADGWASVPLDGTASLDADGYLVAYAWRLNNTLLATSSSATIPLEVGTHEITLSVKDNAGAMHSVTKQIIVEPMSAPAPSTLSRVQVISASARKEITPEKSIREVRVFPNPVKSGHKIYLNVSQAAKQEKFKITLHDMAGRVIQTSELVSDSRGVIHAEFPFGKPIPAGMYLVEVVSALHRSQLKLLLE
ncbi:hypothetical protein AHMF7605_21390 [Adhaeribacter arboris]|uniref:PKD domain-containing protein n=1 Tax=Adhaeribacter arboris TaxID=2072846 RepID=A0A2T2YK44_9BACT|nr:malectin domain-containing carbohydrate-binding protein [Adhaeribacter arboris]PSR55872.1 hypothetical protein AHMF7605_21390 [Adhaeribacter arboris]